jgi:hypothetical protein
VGRDLIERLELAVADHSHRCDRVAARHDVLPGEQLPQDDREREHIAAPVELPRDRLLRGHVRVLAFDLSRVRQLIAGGSGLRDAEVAELHDAVERHHDVRGRDVAVHEAVELAVGRAELVRVVERCRRVRTDARDQRDRQALVIAVLEQLAGVHAVDELHRDEVVVLDFAELVDVDDVGVRQLRRELGLAQEHLHEVR